MEVDGVTRFERAWDRFWTDPRKAYLAIEIIGIDEVDVERDLTVNAHGLNLLHHGRFRTFEHQRAAPSGAAFLANTAPAPKMVSSFGCFRSHARKAWVGETITAFSF